MFESETQLPTSTFSPSSPVDPEQEPGIAGMGDGISTLSVVVNCDTINIGSRARFVGLSDGVKLEVLNSGGTWVKQAEWTES